MATSTGSEAFRLDGRRAVVTGASRGIGHAIAQTLMELGAGVIAVGRDAAVLDAAVDAWRERGLDAGAVAADVTLPEGRTRIDAAVRERWDALDVLVNNAGTNIRKRFEDYDDAEQRALLDVNLEAAMALSRQLHPLLRRRPAAGGDDGGRDASSIVNVASVAALTSVGTGGVYAAAKAGLAHLSRYLAVEWGGDGIRVNCVAPWYIRTPLVEPVLSDPERLAKVLAQTPLGRIGEPAEVANVVAFLCSPAAAYVSGAIVPVDGGMLGDQRVM